MRLTTKGRFAVTAMLDMALRQSDGPVTLASIAARQKISLSYLEQLFGKLRRHGLVASVRGPGGGYTAGKELPLITVAAIIRAVDEPLDATNCGGKRNCRHDRDQCMTHDLWSKMNNLMYDYLNSVSLAELVAQQAPLTLANQKPNQPPPRALPHSVTTTAPGAQLLRQAMQ